jgi:hypothetical protein
MDFQTYLLVSAAANQLESSRRQPLYSASQPTYTPPTSFIGSNPTNKGQWESRLVSQFQSNHRKHPDLDYDTEVSWGKQDVEHLVDLRNKQLENSTRTKVARGSGAVLSAVPGGKFLSPRLVSSGTEGYYERNLGLGKEDLDDNYRYQVRKASGRQPLHEVKKAFQKGVKKTIRDINRANIEDGMEIIGKHAYEFADSVAPHVSIPSDTDG